MEKNKKKLFASIGICMLLMLPFVISGIISDHIDNEIVGKAVDLAGRVLSAAGILLYIRKAYKIEIGIKKDNLAKGIFRYGILIFCTVIFNIICEYQKPEISFIRALPTLLFYLIANMGVGLMEETLCRGFLFNVFKGYWGDNKKGVYLATFVSAFIFGSIHLFNLNGHNTIATITQVAYATFFGALFAVVYYRSGNLLSCIILHGLVDFSANVWPCFLKDRTAYLAQEDVTDYPMSIVLAIAAVTLPLVISALVQLHNEFKNRKNDLVTAEM